MVIIDSQVHAYAANTPQRLWHRPPEPPQSWPDHVTGDEMAAAMDEVGVDGAIMVSPISLYAYDASYAIDHLGFYQPRTKPAPANVWADLPKVLELARRPNAAIKVSGVCTMSREPFPYPDIWDPLARVFDAWGFERCLWGTDWTRTFSLVNYRQGVEPFRLTDRLNDSERAMLMGGACAKVYGWSPKKGQ